MAVKSQLPYPYPYICVCLPASYDLTWHGGQAVASSTLTPEPRPPGPVKHRMGGACLSVMIIDTQSVHFNSSRHTSAPLILNKYKHCHRYLQYYFDPVRIYVSYANAESTVKQRDIYSVS